jgi:23S rRNA (uridine2552-2'-O)-methyltransferase
MKTPKRSKSSQRWMKEHFDDEYVRKAQQKGYRSRAVFKLEEIQQKDKLIRPGMVVVDLGAAPGGWSQYAQKIVGPQGAVIALDLLPIEPLEEVVFIQGDFREQPILDELLSQIQGRSVDLVISDMAPNISGQSAVDQPRSIYLCELALDFAQQVLSNGGDLLIKAFQGEGFNQLEKDIKAQFDKVIVRKPKASRARSREVYILARGYNM